ncbi:BMC domain-containing protein [Tindallia californiensis]|uniref:Carboxysome shell and ethanolamine utilization microcompartment protein CcmL/EutN n=1 Tax=Tindallia californiensis TaxID=159292 RepID=A0A1H3LSU3_9FIRM|nr:BMC domain-containing protein [Tindallia californiensis]SDY67094.1 Carboxysome shell and ethanolamine utilization microcompartment protein CcmL/EutN [Tindallia californiensis]
MHTMTIRTLGVIELNSIAKGYLVTDTMLKAGNVDLVKAHSICPGKYLVLISGDVGGVKAAMSAGLETGAGWVVDHLTIANIHPGIIPAITGTGQMEMGESLGVLEFFGVVSGIAAADQAAKAAQVELIELRLGFAVGGKSFVTLTGDISAVTAAVEVGTDAAETAGLLVNQVIIPRPHQGVMDSLV